MKTSTVDLVVTGDERGAVAAAVDAVQRGQRVLVVLRSNGARVVPRLRRLCRAAQSQVTVMANADVVCVDGVAGVEAVVVRYTRTGHLRAVNTPAFLFCDGSRHPPPEGNPADCSSRDGEPACGIFGPDRRDSTGRSGRRRRNPGKVRTS